MKPTTKQSKKSKLKKRKQIAEEEFDRFLSEEAPRIQKQDEEEHEQIKEVEGQPLFFFGPPPAIKQTYKSSGFDKEFHPEDLLAHMREGHTRSEIIAAWGITYSMFNDWLDSYPELAQAYSIGKPAFDAYHKRALRFVAYGMMPKAKEYSLHFLLKNQAGFVDEGGGHEFGDSQEAELEFVDDKE